MSPFAFDKRDINFCLFEYLDIEQLLKIPDFSEFNREILDMVLAEAYKFSAEEMGPLAEILDQEGLGFENGKVSMPKEAHKVYRGLTEGGWVAPSGSVDFGGQGLPLVINTAILEILGTYSMPLVMAPGLSRAAGEVLEHCASDELKQLYLEKLYSGQWTGSMCLTESSAGSAVGDSKTKAKKDGDHYLIEGEKIFITFGEHDLTENIIHLVLARTENAPKGIKGISLFVVPKIKVGKDGSLGEMNNVVCGNIEHKMGIHGSPTCTMIFGADGPCHGYLIGEENQGIRYMFLMMNEARIGVALQGLACATASYQDALAYAKERIQGVDMKDMRDVEAPRVPIIKHPDVRRNLLTMKAFSEGMRALIYYTAKCTDLSVHAEEEETRNNNKLMADLLTPICKAYCSDSGFQMTALGIQILGGYGYTKEYPLERYCRDAKIGSIYEGTNGIQALDLLGRKVAGKGAASFMTFLNQYNEFIDQHSEHESLGEYVKKLAKGRDALTEVVMNFQKAGMEGDFYFPLLCATPFLEMFGILTVSYLLLDMAIMAEKKRDELFATAGASNEEERKRVISENPEASFYDGKIHSMRFFLDTYLPQAQGIAENVRSGNRSPLDINF